MIDVLSTAVDVEKFFREKHWDFAFIGGIANLAWGETRSTVDVDVSLFTSFDHEAEFAAQILERFPARVPSPIEFARVNKVLLLTGRDGIGIDVALAGWPYEELAIKRSKEIDFGIGEPLNVISAEDLIVMKAFAGRSQDWADVEGVIRRQGPKLDWQYVRARTIEMGAIIENPTLVDQIEKIRADVGM
jgi:hypothetical protein